MFSIKIAVKFGSDEIIVYRQGVGVIARHPAFLAVSARNGLKSVKAYGREAQKMLDNDKIKVYKPIEKNEIVNEKYATLLIKKILEDSILDKLFLKFINAVAIVPCGTTYAQLTKIKTVFRRAGMSKVTFVQNAVCVRYDLDDIDSNVYSMVVDIGKYCTDVSVLNKHDFYKGKTLIIGGHDMDIALQTYIADNHGLDISLDSAEKVKKDIASLYNKDMFSTEYKAFDEYSALVTNQISANEVRVAIGGVFETIFDNISKFIQDLPKEIQSDLHKTGIMFVGGVANIAGLYEYAKKRLDFPITVSHDPSVAVVLGAGKMLASGDTFTRINFK